MRITVFISLFLHFYALSLRLHAQNQSSEERVYSDKIKSVLFYPLPDTSIGVPIIMFGQSVPLILEFDELQAQPSNLFYKIYHFNADWKQSYLAASQYLSDFNEYRITDRDMSFKSRIPYYHYTVTIPKVKVSGNYLIKVYREYDEEQVVLTKQFVVYENIAPVTAVISRAVSPADAFKKQQVNFQIDYTQLAISNLYTDVKVVLRQNYKDYNAIRNLKPVYIMAESSILDYQFFNNENAFNGGNEFRYFDMRSVLFNGIYMERVVRANDKCDVWIQPEQTRNKVSYSFYDDLNGAYYPQLYESLNGTTDPDYALVHFKLESPQPAPGNVYITGRFNNWKTDPEYQLSYDSTEKAYTGAFFMKQGYYNYMYTLITPDGKRDDIYFEGNSAYAENAYDIIVYARVQSELCDRAIGYFSQRFRGR
jgi:hypothetical protein